MYLQGIYRIMKKKKTKYFIALIAFLVVIAIGIVLILREAQKRKSAAEKVEEITETVNDVEPVKDEVEETPYSNLGIEIPEKNLDWNKLHKENEDIYAWITVTDTTVDYPVLQHPTDNTYYLNNNIDGTPGYPGCIYTEDYNAKDFSDKNTVLYGHNLKDKTMFSSLHNYEDDDTFSKDQYIYIWTENDVFVYKVFAAYEFNSNHLLLNYDYNNEYVYEQYIKDIFNVKDNGYGIANIKDDIDVTKEDRIITLSTCTADHNSDQRFLVVGVLIPPEE